jgi:SAM-dependent methyltransferase
MRTTTCPLCSTEDAKLMETINTNDLVNLYVNAYKVDFSYLFKQNVIHYYQCSNCDLRYFSPSVIGDENFYNVLQKTDMYYMDDKEEYDFASGYITEKDDVLEIGCGKAAFSRRINCRSYTGLEFSANATMLSVRDGAHVINQTIQEHAVSNAGKYDVVCTFQVLEHVDCNKLFAFLKAATACLKVNGRLIISVPSADSFLSEMVNSTLNLPPHHQSHWPDKSLKTVAELFNLGIVCLRHDMIALQNRREYLSVKLRYLLTFEHKLIRPEASIVQKTALKLLRLIPDKVQFFVVDNIRPNGHSITAIYQKNHNQTS